MKIAASFPGLALLAALYAAPGAQAAGAGASAVIDIGSQRELWVDGALVGRLGGKAELRLHQPVPREVVMVFDAPWEGNATCYCSVFQDGGLYRMYYRAWKLSVNPDGVVDANAHPQVVCYAESDDGIHFRRPKLGLHAFQGSKANNIVFVEETIGGVTLKPGNEAVFKDDNPDATADARYKTFRTGAHAGLVPFKSPDGIHWSPLSTAPVIVDPTRNAFDSQNCEFWDAVRGEYRVYWRFYDPARGGRSIRTATSKDFLHWENREDLSYVDSPAEELYENCVKPYARAPQLLLGLPVRYVERGWSDSMRSLPDRQNREMRAGHIVLAESARRASAVAGSREAMDNGRDAVTVHERYGTALTEGLIMASRDGVSFKRWNEAFIPPGIERTGTWNYGQVYVSWHLVETKSSLDGAPNELSLYASEGYWMADRGSRLRRYTLRLDGFVSATAPLSGGEVITKPLRFRGRNLSLNFATSAAGSVRIEIQDLAGKPLPGFSLEDCPPLFGDTIDRVVSWKQGADVGAIAGKPVRLRMALNDADLYSFRFAGE